MIITGEVLSSQDMNFKVPVVCVIQFRLSLVSAEIRNISSFLSERQDVLSYFFTAGNIEF